MKAMASIFHFVQSINCLSIFPSMLFRQDFENGGPKLATEGDCDPQHHPRATPTNVNFPGNPKDVRRGGFILLHSAKTQSLIDDALMLASNPSLRFQTRRFQSRMERWRLPSVGHPSAVILASDGDKHLSVSCGKLFALRRRGCEPYIL